MSTKISDCWSPPSRNSLMKSTFRDMSKYWFFHFFFHLTLLYSCEIVKMRINIHSILVLRKFCLREANWFAICYVTIYLIFWLRESECGFLYWVCVNCSVCVCYRHICWLYSTEKPDYGWLEFKTTQTLMLPYDQKNGCWVLSSL